MVHAKPRRAGRNGVLSRVKPPPQTSGIRIVFTGQHWPGSNSLYISRALEQCGATVRFLDDTRLVPDWRSVPGRAARRLLLSPLIEPEWNLQLLELVARLRPHLVYITNA